MQIIYSPKAKEHLDFWIKTGNKALIKKIIQLLNAIMSNPYQGIGKPEALKYELNGYWSRRINNEHRLIYKIDIDKNVLQIYSLKGHY